ncbi:MAG: metallophosphoesterase [Mobilicoccus sp.]|nr:metallophosphoesterase [Mobilicoccus sp.]
MARFLQTSDWQLGMTRYFLEGEAQARYTAARIDAIRSIGEVARREQCDFVVVAGDVFDSNLLSTRTVSRALEAMATISCPVYLLPGNHDPLDASSVYRSPVFTAACPPGVVVLDPGLHRVASDVEILAAPWLVKPALVDLAAQALAGVDDPPPGLVRLLLAHGPIDVLTPDDHDPARISLATLESAIEQGRLHHVALGDKHSRMSVGSTGRVHYSGSPEVTDVRDDAPGDVLVVDVTADGTYSVTAHRVGTWAFTTLRRHVNDLDDIDDLDAELAAIDPKDRTVVRTILLGTLTLAEKARLDDLLEKWGAVLAAPPTHAGLDDIAVVLDPDDLTDLGVGGFVAGAVADLAERASGSDPDITARDALSLLHRLASAR